MDAGALLKEARHRAGLTQRRLADLSGVAQPLIARIESRSSDPRFATLDRLLRSCGLDIRLGPRLGIGVDRTVIRGLLALTPRQRLDLAVEEAGVLGIIGPR